MEKATEVYNKLKLRFVGKSEVAAKPKPENKDEANNEDSENKDPTPLNGESEQKREDEEKEEEKLKSPLHEEHNDHPSSSPNRRSLDSPAEPHSNSFEEEDNSISAEMEPAAIES